MAVDASAILAIALHEDDAALYVDALAKQPGGVMSPINYWEVLARMHGLFGPSGFADVDKLLAAANVRVAPADAAMVRSAAEAFARFGRRTAGALNLGDCFAYALASSEGDGLLYKGNDFPKTDVKSAL